jgi:hypothetical protein
MISSSLLITQVLDEAQTIVNDALAAMTLRGKDLRKEHG